MVTDESQSLPQSHSKRPEHISVGFRSRWLNDERLKFMAQIGVEDVFVDVLSPGYEADAFPDDMDTDGARHLELSPESVPSVDRLVELKDYLAKFDLEFAGIHSLHYGMYGDIMFDREGRDRQVDAIVTLLENLGAAGIDTLGYQWNPRGVVPMRTGTDAAIRGGATATRWNEDDLEPIQTPPGELERTYSEEECWENYEEFLAEILPVAEEAGVRMALHPADPPVYEEIGGVPRLFRNAEAFERAMSAVPSDAHGLKLCLGCFSEMGEDVPGVIRRFGDDIVFVHFRDVVGTVPDFTETFLDEGNFDPHEAMTALHEVGFRGPVLLDHVPHVEGDTEWRHRSRAYGSGYLRCLIENVSRQ
ncbi:mannonate dehydratase [Haloarcula marina]|uniref:mannonate dehydratase n=1 Tax=Haloarcula marina TaxID=2961574 RepID=UPI0020B813B7|nr:mannonate dehydratase [Halomicroarcula marina]